MIPKTIHYCWFGGNPLPEEAVKCIESWKKFFSDYEIKCWDETNFNVNACDYTKEAYEAKKWAFVSDYARFWILYHEGGLYFDTDVEVIKDFGPVLKKGAFMGCEIPGDTSSANSDMNMGVAPGLGLGAAAGMDLYKEILDYYERIHFLDNTGAMITETVVAKTTNILVQHGFEPGKPGVQNVAGVWIYPPEYFCPMDPRTKVITITENTFSIHHYAASWFSVSDKIIQSIVRATMNYGKPGYYVERVASFPFRVIAKFEKLGFKNTLIFSVKKLTGKNR